jgi:hypothetical protein
MSIFRLPKNKKEKECLVCNEVYMATSRNQKYCEKCSPKISFLTTNRPIDLGKKMKAKEARKFIKDNPNWEPPHIKRRSYNQY